MAEPFGPGRSGGAEHHDASAVVADGSGIRVIGRSFERDDALGSEVFVAEFSWDDV